MVLMSQSDHSIAPQDRIPGDALGPRGTPGLLGTFSKSFAFLGRIVTRDLNQRAGLEKLV